MASKTLEEISETIRDIDFAVLSTRTVDGTIAGRPMSNNREVDFKGHSYFFALEHSRVIADIDHDPQVGLSYQSQSGLLHNKPLFIAVEGFAELIRDKGRFAEHWTREMDDYFKQGADTPDLVLIKVTAERMHYWDSGDEGEIVVTAPVVVTHI
jgi:general stress protein 26